VKQLLWTLVILSAMAPGATATTWYVPSVECPTIQAGVDNAAAGDTVFVACGTYYEHDIEMKSGVYLTSETGQPDCLTIDAQQQGRVFRCTGSDTSTSIVGLTMTGGDAPGGNDVAGALYCEFDSNPKIRRCAFVGNTAAWGGAIYCWDNSSPTFVDCTFDGNTAPSWRGGAIFFHGSSAALVSCAFTGNASPKGGALECYQYSSVTLTGCTFSRNSADQGGAMHCENSSSPTLTNCTLVWNTAGSGGGIYCQDGSSPTLANCIIALSEQGAAVHCGTGGSASLTCCDVYNNTGGDWTGCLTGQLGVDGNIEADPGFCDADADDFTLDASSPCLAEHNPTCGLVGAWVVGCDSPVENTSWGCIKAMFH